MPDISLYLPSLRGGGAERSMLTLANAFAEKGLKVDVVLAKAEGPFLDLVAPGVCVVDLDASRVATSLPALIRYLREKRPPAMLSAMHYANVIALCARIVANVPTRLVVSERNTLTPVSHSTALKRMRLMPWLMRLLYPRADAIVAVSAGVAADLSSAIGLPRERISVIYNPVVSRQLLSRSREPVVNAWVNSEQSPIVLAAGRLSAQKDYPTLINAFARIRRERPVRLVILGEGEERASLERQVQSMGLGAHVLLPGFVDNPFSWMRQAAVFVLSSRWEGLPGVLIQAMACGAPVVSTDCPSGPREILADGEWGRLVPVGDDSALAEAISSTLDERDHPDGASRALAFGIEPAVTAYLQILGIHP